MAFKRFLASGLLSVAVLCFVVSTAGATATYVYIGNTFDSVTGAYTTSMSLSGSVTLMNAIDPDLINVNITSAIISFSFSDGLQVSAGIVPAQGFSVSTDGFGNVIQWTWSDVFGMGGMISCGPVLIPGTPCSGFSGATGSESGDLAVAAGSPAGAFSSVTGAWSLVPVPEPGTGLLMGLGLLALGVRGRPARGRFPLGLA